MVNAEFFDALEQLEREKGIPVDYMLDRVGQALITAYKRDNDGMTDNVFVEPDRDKKTIRMYVRKTVVKAEDLYEPYEEITLEEAAEYKNNPMVGDIIDIDIEARSVNVELTDEQLDERRRELEAGDGYVAHRNRHVSQALKAYAAFARSADKGATRDPELINKLSGLD